MSGFKYVMVRYFFVNQNNNILTLIQILQKWERLRRGKRKKEAHPCSLSLSYFPLPLVSIAQ
jgi:hypothetical protein